jgi:hypothetical protein
MLYLPRALLCGSRRSLFLSWDEKKAKNSCSGKSSRLKRRSTTLLKNKFEYKLIPKGGRIS